ncbi:MAG: PAS domain S-box protein [Planctomycetia bacterium]|nr:PAS domain S-box protein [Planctomycetia bacterium]
MTEPFAVSAGDAQQEIATLPVLICFVDTEQRYRFNNGAWVDWFGMPPSVLAGKPVVEVIGESRYCVVLPFIEQALAGRQVAFETLILTVDGNLRQGQVVYVPQSGADGKITGFYALATDITAWKRSQQAAKDSQALYQSLVDHLPMCILRKDREGHITFANKEFYKYSGKTEEAILGKTDFDFYPQELASKYHRDDLKVLDQGDSISDIEAHRTPAGEQKYVQVLKSPVHDAARQIIGVQILFWDVSDRKLAEEHVRESMARKRAIFDAALDCIVVADQQGRIIDFNRAAEKTFGHRRDDVLGQNMDDLLFPKETRRRAQDNRERYEHSQEEGSMIGRRLEATAIRKNGEIFDVETAMQAIPLEGKTVFAIFLQDITVRKRAQEELAAKNKDLETLLYVTSHDLREPLRSIESFARLVKDRYADKLDDKGKDFLQRITDGTKRLDRLIEDVLMLSRAQRTHEPVADLSSADLVAEVLKQLEGKIEATQARIIVNDNLPTLKVDRRWARQAVYNLVANALKFTKPGEHPDIEITAYSPQSGEREGLGLEVHDRGTGVNADDAERIFGLFQRAVGQQIEGTGAGLAIVQQVAVRHGGNAWVRPRDGGGSEFVVCFG